MHIEDIASFMNCNCTGSYANPLGSAKNLYLNDTLISSLTVPEEVAAIKNLESCNSLKRVEIHKNAEMQHDYVFQGCTNLTSIVFRNRLSSEIPSGAPWGATNAIVSTWNDASQEWVEQRLRDEISSLREQLSAFSEILETLSAQLSTKTAVTVVQW